MSIGVTDHRRFFFGTVMNTVKLSSSENMYKEGKNTLC